MVAVSITMRAIEEFELGPKWQAEFERRWPAYREWFLQEGDGARPGYVTSLQMLRDHMPELVPVYERLVELAGGGDLAARMLALYSPPPYLAACSQGVWTRAPAPMLVRNYDYSPSRFEGTIWSTRMVSRRVVGTGDCLWGLLDGMNDDGLAVSLTFGGRRVLGEGFGIPLVVRYLLEVCETVAEARGVLERLPYALSHNLTVADRSGAFFTAYLAPDRTPVFRPVPAATNHQGQVEWLEQAAATRTVERERCVLDLLSDPETTAGGFVDAFLREPLLSREYAGGFGTLYTAVFHLAESRVDYRWPGFAWPLSLAEFREGEHTEVLEDAG